MPTPCDFPVRALLSHAVEQGFVRGITFSEAPPAFTSVTIDTVDTAAIKESGVGFNVGGNKYRLIAVIHFNRNKVYVRHVLTHEEYSRGTWKND